MTRGWVRAQLGAFSLDVRWSVPPGQVHVLFGPSGSGKTMTLRTIAGLTTPSDGRIEIGGRTVFDTAANVQLPPHVRRVGYVPQDWLLFPHLNVAANVAYGLRAITTNARQQRVAELLEQVGLSGLADRRVGQLSGGQQQRVALARALAPTPEVVLLDEPFSALDIETRRQVRAEVKRVLKEAGVPVLLVTHDREEALALGDRVTVLDHGVVLAEGDPLAVLGHPTVERVASLVGVENIIELTVESISPHNGTMVCRRSPFRLEVPLADVHTGENVTVGVRADDIIVANAPPVGLSARNIIPGQIGTIEPCGASKAVTIDCEGAKLMSHVTRNAIVDLGLELGAPVWVVIKTSACRILSR